jgi:hypothetical protein
MLAASFYILWCSARNRLRMRLRRLREPRYLIGGIVGAAYMYFSVFARFGSASRTGRRRSSSGSAAAMQAFGAAFAPLSAMVLLAVSGLSWLLPFESGLLEFSDPEVAFLFPAPVSRRQLIVHRMVRSQLGLLVSAIVLAIVMPSAPGVSRVWPALAMWLLLFTARVYFTGVTLARSRFRSSVAPARRSGWLPAALVLAATVVVGRALYTVFYGVPLTSLTDAVDRMAGAAAHGPAAIALWPFSALVAPFFAASPREFARAAASGVLVLAAAITWVLHSDDAFQDAAAEAADRRQASKPAMKAVQFKARATGLPLSLTGRPELALAWKGAMQTLRIVDRRSIARLVTIVIALTVTASSMGRSRGLAATLGVFASIGAGFSILMAPQALRVDLRQDLAHLELLKTWPVGPAAIVRGEILWPGALLTTLAWGCLSVALFLSAGVFTRIDVATRVSIAVAMAILAPALIFAQYIIHNAVALMFPAWVPLGASRPRGLDAMGQRLIMLGGTWILLLVMALPGGIAGGLVWLGFRQWIGAASLVPAASVASGVIAIEVLMASEMLGPAYERVDLSAVERSE